MVSTFLRLVLLLVAFGYIYISFDIYIWRIKLRTVCLLATVEYASPVQVTCWIIYLPIYIDITIKCPKPRSHMNIAWIVRLSRWNISGIIMIYLLWALTFCLHDQSYDSLRYNSSTSPNLSFSATERKECVLLGSWQFIWCGSVKIYTSCGWNSSCYFIRENMNPLGVRLGRNMRW